MRKTKLLWLAPALAGALVLGACAEEEEPAPVLEEPGMEEIQPNAAVEPTRAAQGPLTSISQIIESPATWTGQTFTGEVQVTEVVSDRGFWITDQGERLFVVVAEPPTPGEKINIEPGQTLRLREATVYDDVAGLPPGQLEQQAQDIARSQPVFLGVDAQNINILGQPQQGEPM